MTDTPDPVDRLAAIIDRLETLVPGTTAPELEPFAAGDVPPSVAPGELIESAWGNLVVGRLQAHVNHGVTDVRTCVSVIELPSRRAA